MENFVQFQILPYLENFAGINSTFHVYNFRVISHPRKREIKNTSKFSTHTVTCCVEAIHAVNTVLWYPGEQTQNNRQTDQQTITHGLPPTHFGLMNCHGQLHNYHTRVPRWTNYLAIIHHDFYSTSQAPVNCIQHCMWLAKARANNVHESLQVQCIWCTELVVIRAHMSDLLWTGSIE